MSAALALVREDNAYTQDWLAQAAEMRDRARVKALLANGANVDAATESGMTPLMYAASNGSAEIVQILLDCDAQVNAKRNDGLTAIDLAAFFGQLGVVRLLLQRGADPEARGRVETPAETWARVRGFVDIAEMLRDASAGNLTYPERSHSVRPSVENRPLIQEQGGSNFSAGPEAHRLPGENAEITLAASPVAPDLTAAARIRESEGKESSLPAAVDTVHQQEHAVTQSTTRGSHSPSEGSKSAAANPQFRPGLVFLERITSSWRHLIILTLAVMIVCGGATYGMLRTKDQQSSNIGTRGLQSVTPSATETLKSTTSADRETANHVEPVSNPMATVVRSSTAEVSEVKPEPSARIELAHKLDSRATQHQKPARYTFALFPNQPYATPTRKAAEWSPKRRNLSSIRTVPSSKPDSDITSNAGSTSSKPLTESVDEPKPAPLSVSVSRERSITPLLSNNDTRVADQAVPLVSTRPKRKVIQWP